MRESLRRAGGGFVRSVAVALLMMVLAASFPVQAGAGPFADVPAGHWAYQGLEQLTEAGLVDGYPAGFFSGSRRLTRYEVALTVAKALERLTALAVSHDGGEVPTSITELWRAYNASHPQRPLTEPVRDVLSRAVAEFGPELAMLGYRNAPATAPGTADSVARRGSGREVGGSRGQLEPEVSVVGPVEAAEFALPGAWPVLGGVAAVGQAAPLWGLMETVTGAATVVPVTPYLSLRTVRALRSSWQGEAGATGLGASVRLGDVSLDGRLRSVEPGFEAGLGPGTGGEVMGVGLTVPLGDLRLIGGRDVVQRADEPAEHVTSVALEYSMAAGAQVRAQWESVSLTDLRDARQRTSVGLNLPVGLGAVHLGLAYEDGARGDAAGISVTTLTVAGFGFRVLDNAEAQASFALQESAEGRQRAAALGLRYSLSPEAWLRVGYKLIDFTDTERDNENVATAELTIRF